jgi:hypothetical protein
MAHEFEAVIRKVGINFCVDVPARVSDAFAVRGHVPVKGKLCGKRFASTLVPRGSGRHRLFLNGEVRRAAGVGAGDRVTIELAKDTTSRDLPIPPDLEEALREADVVATFRAFTAFRRREIIVWIDEARQDATRAKRIAHAVEHTIGRAETVSARRRR